MKNLAGLVGAVLLAVAIPVTAQAQERTVAYGTEMRGVMTQSISSSNAYVGETFLLDLVEPYPLNDPGFQGAKVRGHVVSVARAAQGRDGSLGFVLDRIALINGAAGDMEATPVSIDEKRSANYGHVLLTTAGGMVVGNVIGKWLGINIGGGVGALGGLLYGLNKKSDVTVPPGAVVTFQLERSLTLRT